MIGVAATKDNKAKQITLNIMRVLQTANFLVFRLNNFDTALLLRFHRFYFFAPIIEQ